MSSETVSLLPCPFCGAFGEDLMMFCDPEESRDNSGPSRRIQCASCNIEAPFYDTEDEAVAAWNRRTPTGGGWMRSDMLRALKMARDAFTGLSDDLPDVHVVRTAILRAERQEPAESFSAWLAEGPKLAKAAGCYVGIKVTEAKP